MREINPNKVGSAYVYVAVVMHPNKREIPKSKASWYSIKDISNLFDCDNQTIRRHIKNKNLRAEKFSKELLVSSEELFTFFRGHTKGIKYDTNLFKNVMFRGMIRIEKLSRILDCRHQVLYSYMDDKVLSKGGIYLPNLDIGINKKYYRLPQYETLKFLRKFLPRGYDYKSIEEIAEGVDLG